MRSLTRYLTMQTRERMAFVNITADVEKTVQLAEMGKTLLQFEQSLLNIFLVSDSDVAPHTVWTCRNTRHFSECASSGVEHWLVAVFIDEKRGECSRDQLRQVTDPGTELVVLLGIDGYNTRADFSDPLEKFSA